MAAPNEKSEPRKLHILVFEPGKDPYETDIDDTDEAMREVLGDRVNNVLHPRPTIGFHCAFHGERAPDWTVMVEGVGGRMFEFSATGTCFATGMVEWGGPHSITASEIALVKGLGPVAATDAETWSVN
jgi:hypothetical protein